MEKKLLEANEALKNKKYDEAIHIYKDIKVMMWQDTF